jgi:hypothetical protein
MIQQFAPIRRLIETVMFFRAHGLKLGVCFLGLYLPVIALNLLMPGLAGEAQEKARLLGLSYLIHFLYQPIYTGALIYWLARIESGEAWSLKDGLVVGVSLWDKLILVNLITHCLIILGALAFILPGLIAYARLSLVEFRVVLNRDAPQEALRNSVRLTRPLTWEILASSVFLLLAVLLLELLFGKVFTVFSAGVVVEMLSSSLLSVVLLLNLTILLFRFYGLAGGRGDVPNHQDPHGADR